MPSNLFTILALGAILTFSVKAHADERVRLLRRYPGGKIYVTFNVLSGIKTCMNNPSTYNRLHDKYGDVVDIVKDFAQRITPRMQDSPAFLVVDFQGNNAFYKMTYDHDGVASPVGVTWTTSSLNIAILMDAILSHEIEARTAIADIKHGDIQLDDAWVTFKKIHGDSHVSTTLKAQAAFTLKNLYFTDHDKQHEFFQLNNKTKDEISKLLFDTKDQELIVLGKPDPPLAAVQAFDKRVPSIVEQ